MTTTDHRYTARDGHDACTCGVRSAAHRSDCGDMVVGLTDNGDHVVILTEGETW